MPADVVPLPVVVCARCAAAEPRPGWQLCGDCQRQSSAEAQGFVLVLLRRGETRITKEGFIPQWQLDYLLLTLRRRRARKDPDGFIWHGPKGSWAADLVEDLTGAGLTVDVRDAGRETRAEDLLQVLLALAPHGATTDVGNVVLAQRLGVGQRQVRQLLAQLEKQRQVRRSLSGPRRLLQVFPVGDAPTRIERSTLAGRRDPSHADPDVRLISDQDVSVHVSAPDPGTGAGAEAAGPPAAADNRRGPGPSAHGHDPAGDPPGVGAGAEAAGPPAAADNWRGPGAAPAGIDGAADPPTAADGASAADPPRDPAADPPSAVAGAEGGGPPAAADNRRGPRPSAGGLDGPADPPAADGELSGAALWSAIQEQLIRGPRRLLGVGTWLPAVACQKAEAGRLVLAVEDPTVAEQLQALLGDRLQQLLARLLPDGAAWSVEWRTTTGRGLASGEGGGAAAAAGGAGEGGVHEAA